MITTNMRTKDGLVVYDLDPQASELWAVAGPEGFTGTVDTDDLPDGFRWVDNAEWSALQAETKTRRVRQSDIDDLKWHQLPQDSGQIVDVTYADDGDWLYYRRHDRSDNTSTIYCTRIDNDADEDQLRFEPWNGLLPATTGDEYTVIVGGR